MQPKPFSLLQRELFTAVRERNEKKIYTLLEYHNNLSQCINFQSTDILHYAVEYGSTHSVRLLLEHNADPNTIFDGNKEGYTSLHYAVRFHRKTKLLLEHNADPNAESFYGNTPLHTCCEYDGKIENIKLLLDYGANINATNSKRKICLHFAAVKNHERMKVLLSYNPEINSLDYKGQTPLHIAARRMQTKIVKLLLDNGADAHQKDYYNETPLDIAWNLSSFYDKDKIVQLLEER